MKLIILIGTRPEIIRLAPTIKKCRQLFSTTLVHTGQNYDYELNDIFFRDLELAPPDIYLHCTTKNLGNTVGCIIEKSYELFVELKPDALLLLGDTNSCLSAYSAKRLKIPVFHLEAGNRCFDPNVPEEINRRLVDHLSDVNMCYMDHAKQNLILENFPINRLFVIGSPIGEVKEYLNKKLVLSTILDQLNLQIGKYIVFSCHREENTADPRKFGNVLETIFAILEKYKDFKIVFSVHPRIREKINCLEGIPNLILNKPFGLIDYYSLQINSYAVISDSGTLTEESSLLNFSGILLRDSTEHPEGVDSGSIIIGNITKKNILLHLENIPHYRGKQDRVACYETVYFSDKVVKIISGYTDIINHYVWRKT